MKKQFTASLLLFLITTVPLLAAATPIPLNLPRPDGQPGNPDKPVKVYILAGQSNMVGMGDIKGAQPYRKTVFLSADPALIPGTIANEHGLARHGVFQSDDPDAPAGAKVSVYAGAYDPAKDYSTLTAESESIVPLGTVAAKLPAMDGAHTVVVRSFIDVPADFGIYTVHPGYESSTYAITKLAGREVYRREPGDQAQVTKIELYGNRRYPLEITYLQGGSAAFFLRQVDIRGRGDLETITKVDGLFPYLLDDGGNWSERKDVYFRDARLARDSQGSFLTATSNGGRSVGPELGFGHVLGNFHDEQVLLIKTAQGNRALGFDFRPPSSGLLHPDDANEALEYRLMIEGVRDTLDRIAEIVPGYQGQGYEIAGFAWWQGHKDRFDDKLVAEYEQNLVNLIKDVRKEFNAPELPAVIATVGFGGHRLQPQFQGIFDAQIAVADPANHPEFAGRVATIDTRDFWREVRESPKGEDHHYNRNAETYLLVGEALGRAMVALQGGKAEPIPPSSRAEQIAADEGAERTEPTEADKAAAQVALQSIVRHGLAPEFIAQNCAALERAAEDPNEQSEKALNGLVALYNTVGIHDFDWESFGPVRTEMEWDYHSFDPVEQPKPGTERNRLGRYREVTYPAGMENWYKPEFGAIAAGWQRGRAPFASLNGELKAVGDCIGGFCGCGEEPHTLWKHEVLLKRGVFAVPPLEKGYAYRILIGGMSHVSYGDGTRVYLNGDLIYSRRTAVDRRMGGVAIGTIIGKQWWPAFDEGKIHLAATSFLKYYERTGDYGNFMTVFFQRMKLPPVDM